MYKSISLFVGIFVSAHVLFAQTKDISVNIINTENKTITFSAADLNSLPQTTINVKGEDGVTHNYTGVDIYLLLNKAGVFFEKAMRRQTLNSYMLIKATALFMHFQK